MNRQTVASRAFSPVVLSKLGLAAAIAGGYYLFNGPLVSFEKNAYGLKGLLPGSLVKLPAGVNG